MKKLIFSIIAIAMISGCLTTSGKISPLPPTPPLPPIGKTLTPDEIGKKHTTISTGLENIDTNSNASKKAAENIKEVASIALPENKSIPEQANGIISNSNKIDETVQILQKENAELRQSSLVAADSIVRLQSDGEYLRQLLDQSKTIHEGNLKALTQTKIAEMDEYKKKVDKEAKDSIATYQQTADDKIASISKENIELKKKNEDLESRVGGLQKVIESTLGKVFIPFIALGALLLAGGIGSFFGLFELAGKKAFGLIAAGTTMITVGTIIPIVLNSAAKALDPTVCLILKISMWTSFVGIMAYIAWLIYSRIRSIKTEQELVQTVAVYKEKLDQTNLGENAIQTLKDEIKTQVLEIQSNHTKKVVQRIRRIVGDKKDEKNSEKDNSHWMLIFLLLVFVAINLFFIWFAINA